MGSANAYPHIVNDASERSNSILLWGSFRVARLNYDKNVTLSYFPPNRNIYLLI